MKIINSKFLVLLGLTAFLIGILFLSPVRVSASPSRVERVWSWDSGFRYPNNISISKDGEHILVWEETGYNNVWLFSKSTPTPLWKKEGTSGALSPKGNYVALSQKGSVRLIQAKDENLIRVYSLPFDPKVGVDDIDISEGGPYTLVETTRTTYPYWGGGPHSTLLFGPNSSEPVWKRELSPSVMQISSDGSTIAVGADKLYLFSNSDNTPLWTRGDDHRIQDFDLSSNGEYLAVVDRSNLYLFSRSSGTPIWTYHIGKDMYNGRMDEVSISSDGGRIAVGSTGSYGGKPFGRIQLFSSNDNNPLWTHDLSVTEMEEYPLWNVGISGNGEYVIASVAEGGGIARWPYKIMVFEDSSDSPIWVKEDYCFHFDQAVSESGGYFAGIDAARNVRLYRINITYDLDVSVDPSAGGSVSLSPPGGTYHHGATVTVTANPSGGYRFDHWSGDASGISSSIDVTMKSEKSITAVFKESEGEGGTETPGESGRGGGTEQPLPWWTILPIVFSLIAVYFGYKKLKRKKDHKQESKSDV